MTAQKAAGTAIDEAQRAEKENIAAFSVIKEKLQSAFDV
jgi:hypothetical protein